MMVASSWHLDSLAWVQSLWRWVGRGFTLHCIEATLATKSGDSLLMSQSSWKEGYPPPQTLSYIRRDNAGRRGAGGEVVTGESRDRNCQLRFTCVVGQKEEKLG